MPVFHAMAKRANAALTREGLGRADPDTFAEPGSLVAGLRALGVVDSDEEAAFVGAFPTGLQEAVRALLHDNLVSDAPLDVTVAWAPGYEDELSLWQVAGNANTSGGITVLVKSRYPADRGTPGTGISQ